MDANQVQEIERLEKEEQFYDLATLRALANSLYDYARNEVAVGPSENLSRENMLNGLSGAVGFNRYIDNAPEYVGIIETINRRHPV